MSEHNELFTIDNLYRAYRACRRNKRGAINTLRFEANLLDNLCSLREELAARSYHPTTSICFVQRRPKLREIFAAHFRDRVVHHLLVGALEPLLEPVFIHDSYACRRGKGVHAAVTRLQSFLHKATANGTAKAWYLKEDVSGFFMNIDKNILYDLVCRRARREDVRWLAGVVIFHDCTRDYHFKGNARILERIPAHKTLFRVGQGKGLPIGNLTSQFFANVYLNELDQFVKRKLGCRYYLRYCDDFVLLDGSAERLVIWRRKIEEFLHERLLLDLNHKQHRLRPASSGIDYLGYIVRRRYLLVRRRVVSHLRERLDRFERQLGVYGKAQPVGCFDHTVVPASEGTPKDCRRTSGRMDKVAPLAPCNPSSPWNCRMGGAQRNPSKPQMQAHNRRMGEVTPAASRNPSRPSPLCRRERSRRSLGQGFSRMNSGPGRGAMGCAARHPSHGLLELRGWRYPAERLAMLRSTLASYLGHFQWASSHRLVQSLRRQYGVLDAAFLFNGCRILPRYQVGKGVQGLRRVYRWYVPPARRPIDPPQSEVLRPLWTRDGEQQRVLVFFPVGRFYEFYDGQARLAHQVLGLKLRVGLRGFRHGCGFHRRWLPRFLNRAHKTGCQVALIGAKRQVDGSIDRRLVRLFGSVAVESLAGGGLLSTVAGQSGRRSKMQAQQPQQP